MRARLSTVPGLTTEVPALRFVVASNVSSGDRGNHRPFPAFLITPEPMGAEERGLILLPFVVRAKVFTLPEFLQLRFDGRLRLYFSGLTLF